MANYYHSYSTPGSSSSRASSGSPLSSVYSQSPPDSTGYFSFSSAPPSPYYYASEFTGSPEASPATTNDSYQGSVSSRSSSSQGHYRHPSSSSSTSSSSYNQAAVYDHSQYNGRTSKRQRVVAPVDPTGHLQPHWMGSANQTQAHNDFAAGMYHQHTHPQMQMSYPSPASATGRHPGGGYTATATAAASLAYPQVSIATAPSSAPAQSTRRHASPTQTGQQKTHGGCQEGEEVEEIFEHGPTELPPRTFAGHSKYNPPKKPGKIPGSAMDYLPILEARFERLENAIDRYIDYRGQRALNNSILPGSSKDSTSTKARWKTGPFFLFISALCSTQHIIYWYELLFAFKTFFSRASLGSAFWIFRS